MTTALPDENAMSGFEMSASETGRAEQVAFNTRLSQQAGGLLADVTGLERYCTVSSGHTAAFVKAVCSGCLTSEPELASSKESQRLNKEELCQRDRTLKTMVEEGWTWTVIAARAEQSFPQLAALAEVALNSSNASFQQQLEVELALQIANLAMQTTHQEKVDFSKLAENVCMSTQLAKYCKHIGLWVERYSDDGKLVTFLATFTKDAESCFLGEEFWQAAASSLWPKDLRPLCRVALIATGLTAPPIKIVDGLSKLITRSDWDKLRGKKLQAPLTDMEKQLYDAWKLVDLGEVDMIRAFGRLCIRSTLWLLGKENLCCQHNLMFVYIKFERCIAACMDLRKMGREGKKHDSLAACFALFQQEAHPGQIPAVPASASSSTPTAATMLKLDDAYDPLFVAKQKVKLEVGNFYTMPSKEHKVFKLTSMDPGSLVLEWQDLFQRGQEKVVIFPEEGPKLLRPCKSVPSLLPPEKFEAQQPNVYLKQQLKETEAWVALLKAYSSKFSSTNLSSLLAIEPQSRKLFALTRISKGQLVLMPGTDAVSKLCLTEPDGKQNYGCMTFEGVEYYILPPSLFKDEKGSTAPYWYIPIAEDQADANMDFQDVVISKGVSITCLVNSKALQQQQQLQVWDWKDVKQPKARKAKK